MHIMLIVVTIFSLTLAAIMSVVAWRLAREERRRSVARVAALAMEIHSQTAPADDLTPRPSRRREAGGLRVGPPRLEQVGPTVASPGGSDAEREGANVSGSGGGTPRRFEDLLELRSGPIPSGHSDLFAAAEPGASPASRFAAVVALGIFVVGAGAALAVVLSGGSRGAANPAPTHAPVASGSNQTLRADASSRQTVPIESLPLELVALGHERDADRLTIRGVVRNPPSGNEASGLVAVVFLFNRDGGFLTSGRAAIDASALAPGAESPFAVTVAGAADAGRYRVSFRSGDSVVPHVDRRDAKLEVSR
jgi:hypothetical protein